MQDSTDAPQLPADDEIDLLDLLVTVADNIKLLIVGTMVALMVAGLVALEVGYTTLDLAA